MKKIQAFYAVLALTTTLSISSQVLAVNEKPADKATTTAPVANADATKTDAVKKPKVPFIRGDADKDGRLSEEEFITDSKNRFKDMDKDLDGFVTKEERDAFSAAERAKREAAKAAKEAKAAAKAEEKPKGLFGNFFK